MAAIDRISQWLGNLAAVLLLLTGIFLSWEVLGRYVFNAPTKWASELSELFLLWGVFLGLARTGSTAHHSSGEIFLAAALGLRAPRGESPTGTPVTGRDLDPYFEAVVDASEEAVLASLLAAHDVTGVEGRTIAALPVDRVRRLLEGRTP